MAAKLKEKDRWNEEAFVRELGATLSDLIIINNIFLDYQGSSALSDIEAKLPAEKTSVLNEYIGKDGFRYLAECEITGFLNERLAYTSQANPQRLAELVGAEGCEHLAQKIIRTLNRIPIKYSIVSELPPAFYELRSGEENEVNLFDDLKIVFDKELMSAKYNAATGLSFSSESLTRSFLFKSDEKEVWKDRRAYLVSLESGYCGVYGNREFIDNYTRKVKSFFGLMFAVGDVDFFYLNDQDVVNRSAVCFEIRSKRHEQRYKFDLHTDLQSAHKHKHWDFIDEIAERGSVKALQYLKSGLAAIKKVGDIQSVNPKVRLASHWYFDSLVSDETTMAFVQAATAMEVLFGNKAEADEIGLGNLLSNRYAFLTGTNHQDRQEKLNEFKRLYQIRCKIVHGGVTHLKAEEKDDLHRIRRACTNSIKCELGLSPRANVVRVAGR